ncbi:hypothetical protein EON77_09600 [bacterium]|nr:MAG: hypothetical protein EON77_09600 [bacterium]
MTHEPIRVVCMALGTAYPSLYVTRLFNMLGRHMPGPFELTCVTDRKRRLPREIRVIDSRRWEMDREGMRVTTNKLRLFDPEIFPGEFLYLDTTLVIHRDLGPLIDYAFGRPESLVVVKDWNYDCYNTCVMRIRGGAPLETIYQRFREGREYPRRNPGDQDFVTSCVRDEHLENEVATFLPQHVVSYRNARKTMRMDLEASKRQLDEGIVVKFFAQPKMHQVLSPYYRWKKGRKSAEARDDLTFWNDELRTRWR